MYSVWLKLTTDCNTEVIGALVDNGKLELPTVAGMLDWGNKFDIIAAKNEDPCCNISRCVVISSEEDKQVYNIISSKLMLHLIDCQARLQGN